MHALLHLLHVLLGSLWMQDVLKRVFVVLLEPLPGHAQMAALHDVWNDLVMDASPVVLGLHAIEELHLKLSQCLKGGIVVTERLNASSHLRIKLWLHAAKTHHPPYQGTLAQRLVVSLFVDAAEDAELVIAKSLHD